MSIPSAAACRRSAARNPHHTGLAERIRALLDDGSEWTREELADALDIDVMRVMGALGQLLMVTGGAVRVPGSRPPRYKRYRPTAPDPSPTRAARITIGRGYRWDAGY